jgi:hypothetical protein
MGPITDWRKSASAAPQAVRVVGAKPRLVLPDTAQVRQRVGTGRCWLSIGLLVLLVGCGDQASRSALAISRPASSGPASALRGFYAALIGNRVPGSACRFAAPDFYLRPSGIVGVNVPAAVTGGSTLPPTTARADPRPVHGPCPALLERLLRGGRADRYPFSYWKIQRIAVHGASAETVTTDGSSAMRLVGKRWLMQWVFS